MFISQVYRGGAVVQDRRLREIAGISLIIAGLFIFASLLSYHISDIDSLRESRNVLNFTGPIGAWISYLLRLSFGYSSYLFSIMLMVAGWSFIRNGSALPVMERVFSLAFIMVTTSVLLALVRGNVISQFSGGFIGISLMKTFIHLAGTAGAWIITLLINLIGMILLGVVSITGIIEYGGEHRGRMQRFLTWIKGLFLRRKHAQTVPLNNIDAQLNGKKRLPWVVKKKVVLYDDGYYEKERTETPAPRLVELEDMTHPHDTGDDANADQLSFDPFTSVEKEQTSYPVVYEYSRDDVSFEEDHGQAAGSGVRHNRFKILEPEHAISGPIPVSRNEETQARAMDSPVAAAVADEEEDMDEHYFDDGEKVFEEVPINQEYIIPTHFLNSSESTDETSWKTEILRNSDLLVNTLKEFGIESRVLTVNRGPVISLYEMQIAPGIKVNRIVGLADDITMALAASRVRIVAPIPGKKAIGVEVPNIKREVVTLGDIVKSTEYHSKAGKLKVALGKDILGKPVIMDLKQLPHLLIAGATGSGKSVCVNSIITSLVYNYDPNFVRFILVDPKMVELQLYNGIPHLLTPVITDPGLAPKALKWAMYEMERRYYLLSEMNTRDIDRYNEKAVKKGGDAEILPYIVVIMDELADLMMVAAKEIEGFITRIAQKARAVGIHLVLATQRPSVDVITGIIKANFPARVAFQVAQKTDSRTIIDQNGAEKLLGRGDMLYQSPMSSFPVRIQGAYISEDEIMSVVEHLQSMGTPNYIDIEGFLFEAAREEDSQEEDELFMEALKIIEETRKASASYLQRRLSIGYNRAARIIERMEDLDYIGPQQGSKPREVLI